MRSSSHRPDSERTLRHALNWSNVQVAEASIRDPLQIEADSKPQRRFRPLVMLSVLVCTLFILLLIAFEDEKVTVPAMAFEMRCAAMNVEGRYGLDGAIMDFHGTVRTKATASEVVDGWKGLLVMPFDNLLKKNGAGMEIPFRLSGTQKDPNLALDYGHSHPVAHDR